jgi:hypothetical protein
VAPKTVAVWPYWELVGVDQLRQWLRMGPTSKRGSIDEDSQYRKDQRNRTGSWYLPPEILVMAMSWMFRDWTRGTDVFANWVPDLASCLCRAMLLAIWLMFAVN